MTNQVAQVAQAALVVEEETVDVDAAAVDVVVTTSVISALAVTDSSKHLFL